EQKIFEKFYRLDPKMSRGVGGTGLGLYICNELVTRMGGRIWVEANAKKGSTFLFELQAAEATPMSEPRREAVELHGFVTRARRGTERRWRRSTGSRSRPGTATTGLRASGSTTRATTRPSFSIRTATTSRPCSTIDEPGT